MRWIGRALAALALVAVLAGVGVVALAPDPPVMTDAATAAPDLPGDLDAWLAGQETAVPDLRPAARKRIVWAGEAGRPTTLSVVYVHGFSASAEELRPVPDRVAARLGANLFFTRLTGHGRDGAALAEATARDWVADMAEAMAVGRRIGDRVLVMGTSTGGTLAALAALHPEMSRDMAGVALVSPNFRIANAAAPLLTLPGAEAWLPWLAGEERAFEPVNAGHAGHWTTRYPTTAILPVARLAERARTAELSAVTVPALFVYSEHDRVVRPDAVRRAFARWGAERALHPIVPGPGDDPYAHVLAGDILSPGRTDAVVDLVADWAARLGG